MSQLHDGADDTATPDAIEVVSSHNRAGRPFQPTAELALAPTIRLAAASLPARLGRRLLVVPECPLPTGVPDLVALVADANALAARAAAGVTPLLGEQEVRIVAACGPSRPASLATLATLAGVSESHARRVIVSLERRGAVARATTGWVRNPAIAPVGRTYAIEAKVDDARRGLAQALRYATLADAGALVLGRLSGRSRERVVEYAAGHRLGLFTEDRWLVRPRISRHRAARRLWVSEHVFAALGLN